MDDGAQGSRRRTGLHRLGPVDERLVMESLAAAKRRNPDRDPSEILSLRRAVLRARSGGSDMEAVRQHDAILEMVDSVGGAAGLKKLLLDIERSWPR